MTPPNALRVTKSHGQKEPFDADKLRRSLMRAGADDDLVKVVTAQVLSELRAGDATDAIRKRVLSALRDQAHHLAGRYDLKRAVLRLGPDGHAFERFWGTLLEAQGFEARFDVVIAGRCVDHEIDVVADKDGERRLAECKFHRSSSRYTDLRTALYVYARCLDLAQRPDRGQGVERLQLVTNTRFTQEAARYGQCVGLAMVSWDHPRGGSLRELADRFAAYPITCLSTLSRHHAKALIDEGVITCRQLAARPEVLERLGLPAREVSTISKEAAPLGHIGDVLRSAPGQLD